MAMGRQISRIVRLLLLSYLGIALVLFALQRSLLFFPPAPERGLQPDDFFQSDGLRLRWSVAHRDRKKAIIYFGGNAENVAFSLPEYSQNFPDYAIYMIHYRGYGGSEGSPSEFALHKDAEELYRIVRAAHPEICLIGRSLGTGVAVRLAAKHQVDRMVLITPYDSIVNVAAKMYWFLPVRWLMIDRFESWKQVGDVTAPTLVLQAERDSVIPSHHTENLIKSFQKVTPETKMVYGTDHNLISMSREFWTGLANFLNEPKSVP